MFYSLFIVEDIYFIDFLNRFFEEKMFQYLENVSIPSKYILLLFKE